MSEFVQARRDSLKVRVECPKHLLAIPTVLLDIPKVLLVILKDLSDNRSHCDISRSRFIRGDRHGASTVITMVCLLPCCWSNHCLQKLTLPFEEQE